MTCRRRYSPTLHADPENFARELRLAAAVKWYELRRNLPGRAAKVAGLSRTEFIAALGQFGVSPFQYTAREALERPAVSDIWVVNATPLIVLAKAALLHLLSDSCRELLVPEAVVADALAGPSADPARQALQRGFGQKVRMSPHSSAAA